TSPSAGLHASRLAHRIGPSRRPRPSNPPASNLGKPVSNYLGPEHLHRAFRFFAFKWYRGIEVREALAWTASPPCDTQKECINGSFSSSPVRRSRAQNSLVSMPTK